MKASDSCWNFDTVEARVSDPLGNSHGKVIDGGHSKEPQKLIHNSQREE